MVENCSLLHNIFEQWTDLVHKYVIHKTKIKVSTQNLKHKDSFGKSENL